MDGDDVFRVMRRWAFSPPLQLPETIPELDDLVRCLGSDESPVQPPELIGSAEYASRRADTLLLLHDRISVNDEDEPESVLLTETGVTRHTQNLAVAMNSRQILTMLGEDVNKAMTADLIRLSWFVDSMTRRWAMRQMIALVRMVLNVWALNDNHLVRHDILMVRDGECPEHRQYIHECGESIRQNALRIFESIRTGLTARMREKLRSLQLAFYAGKYSTDVDDNGKPGHPLSDSEVAPRGTPGRKPDPDKQLHAEFANDLRTATPQPTWKECATRVNDKFNLTNGDGYDNRSIRELHRLKFGDKSQKKKWD